MATALKGLRIEPFAATIRSLAPTACCDASGECLKAEDGKCQTDPEQAASAPADFVRIGRHQDRTATNPTGGGKKRWHPPKPRWWQLTDLAEELTAAEGLESGFYSVVFGGFEGKELPSTPPLCLQLDVTTPEQETAQSAPSPTQSHFDRLMDLTVRRAELDAKRESAENRTIQKLSRLLIRTHRQQALGLGQNQQILQNLQESVKGITEMLGGYVQVANIENQRGLTKLVNPQAPTSTITTALKLSQELRGWAGELKELLPALRSVAKPPNEAQQADGAGARSNTASEASDSAAEAAAAAARQAASATHTEPTAKTQDTREPATKEAKKPNPGRTTAKALPSKTGGSAAK